MRDVFNFALLEEFNKEYYKNIISLSNVVSEEIAIKNKETEENEYFYIVKKQNTQYLMPSEYLENLPIRILETNKIAYRSKAYQLITSAKSIKIRPEKVYDYNTMINKFMNYNHLAPTEYLIWRIIINTAYSDRINIRAISYPGWLKDSPISVLKLLLGNVDLVNKPSYGKLKRLLNGDVRILGLNEIESMSNESVKNLAKYYEDTGNFAPFWVNDTRATSGTVEEISLHNHSSLTFYNFPEKDNEKIFDVMFKPKVRSRIMPVFLTGGSHKQTAVQHKFEYIEPYISEEEKQEIIKFIRTWLYYDEHWLEEYKQKPYEQIYHFNNVRWERSYTAICKRITLYAKTEEEYKQLENKLYEMINLYEDFVNKYTQNNQKELSEVDKIEEINI